MPGFLKEKWYFLLLMYSMYMKMTQKRTYLQMIWNIKHEFKKKCVNGNKEKEKESRCFFFFILFEMFLSFLLGEKNKKERLDIVTDCRSFKIKILRKIFQKILKWIFVIFWWWWRRCESYLRKCRNNGIFKNLKL